MTLSPTAATAVLRPCRRPRRRRHIAKSFAASTCWWTPPWASWRSRALPTWPTIGSLSAAAAAAAAVGTVLSDDRKTFTLDGESWKGGRWCEDLNKTETERERECVLIMHYGSWCVCVCVANNLRRRLCTCVLFRSIFVITYIQYIHTFTSVIHTTFAAKLS